MTNEQKAAILENEAREIDRYGNSLVPPDGLAALLREAAAMMREQKAVKVQWDTEGGATKNGLYLWAGPVCNGFGSLVLKGKKRLYLDWHPTLEAAQAAAVAWVDEQEGEDV